MEGLDESPAPVQPVVSSDGGRVDPDVGSGAELSLPPLPWAQATAQDGQPLKPLAVLVQLPSGSLQPATGLPSEQVGCFKARILTLCGVPLARAADFGLALGFAALDEERTMESNDISQGDILRMFERGHSLVANREAELANLC